MEIARRREAESGIISIPTHEASSGKKPSSCSLARKILYHPHIGKTLTLYDQWSWQVMSIWWCMYSHLCPFKRSSRFTSNTIAANFVGCMFSDLISNNIQYYCHQNRIGLIFTFSIPSLTAVKEMHANLCIDFYLFSKPSLKALKEMNANRTDKGRLQKNKRD